MKNKVIIIVFIVLAALLIGAGAISSIYVKEPTNQDEQKKPNNQGQNDPNGSKVAEMESITTPDNKIRFGTTSVFQRNGISGMTINIIPYEDFDKVYLKLTLKLEKGKEEAVIYLENLKQKEQVEHEVQSSKDLSKLKTWSIEIITEDEAQKIWTSQKK